LEEGNQWMYGKVGRRKRIKGRREGREGKEGMKKGWGANVRRVRQDPQFEILATPMRK